MKKQVIGTAVLLTALFLAAPVRAETYAVDSVHSSVTFWAGHLGIAWVQGRFNQVDGMLILDKDNPEKSSVTALIKVDTIDTNNKKRDEHLLSPDFFDAKKFPEITFKSKTVKAVDKGFEVVGDFTMHGVTKTVTLLLKGGKEAEFPKGTTRIGFSAELKINRSDYGMNNLLAAVSNDVLIVLGLEGVKK